MKRIAFAVVMVATITGGIAWMESSARGQEHTGKPDTRMTSGEATPGATTERDIGAVQQTIVVTTIPRGYRDWKFVSAAHEAGALNDIRVVIGNDKAIRAYRSGKPFPEGSIVGRVAWRMVPSEENNRTFGQAQSFVPGDAPDWYLQFLEKNTKKYAATGGWGYSNFDTDLKATTDRRTMYACFECHKAVAARDYIFTKYAR